MSDWRFLSSYGAILVYIARHPQATGLEISDAVGIQERTVRRNIAEMAADGHIDIQRVGRLNHYRVNLKQPLRRPAMAGATVGDLVKAIAPLLEG
jgi:predicted ArsR family transcriptional regulator